MLLFEELYFENYWIKEMLGSEVPKPAYPFDLVGF